MCDYFAPYIIARLSLPVWFVFMFNFKQQQAVPFRRALSLAQYLFEESITKSFPVFQRPL